MRVPSGRSGVFASRILVQNVPMRRMIPSIQDRSGGICVSRDIRVRDLVSARSGCRAGSGLREKRVPSASRLFRKESIGAITYQPYCILTCVTTTTAVDNNVKERWRSNFNSRPPFSYIRPEVGTRYLGSRKLHHRSRIRRTITCCGLPQTLVPVFFCLSSPPALPHTGSFPDARSYDKKKKRLPRNLPAKEIHPSIHPPTQTIGDILVARKSS